MRTLNILKVLSILALGLFLTSCATSNYRSPTLPEHQKAQPDAPYFKNYNSNWIRHGA